ncbi:MAG: rRNA maturation RNase YbeY [Oscillospiraceae bacterium]|nr:rRNA maturation RNase YbeY [Oscillospiraceae bacterium]
MLSAKVYINNDQNKVKIPTGVKMLVRRCCNAVLSHVSLAQKAEVSISFIDDADIQRLNSTYRNIDRPTDVLSFPMSTDGKYEINAETGNIVLGDIVISVERAAEQANAYSRTLFYELAHLTVHSMFHLLGYDHEKGGVESAEMKEQEMLIMEKMGLSLNSSFIV